MILPEIFQGDDPEAQYEAENYRNRENRGRRAGVFANFTTTGSGVVEFADMVQFGLTYIQRPWVSYGATINMDSVRDVLGIEGDDPVPALPVSMGYVTEWAQDNAGNYVGAWVAVSIFFPTGAVGDIEMEHDFTFDAVAIKDVPFD